MMQLSSDGCNVIFLEILSPSGLVQQSWRLKLSEGSSSVNPEVRYLADRAGVLFPRGNYFRLRRYKVFHVSVLQTKSERCQSCHENTRPKYQFTLSDHLRGWD